MEFFYLQLIGNSYKITEILIFILKNDGKIQADNEKREKMQNYLTYLKKKQRNNTKLLNSHDKILLQI